MGFTQELAGGSTEKENKKTDIGRTQYDQQL